jgi:hypothetical protein
VLFWSRATRDLLKSFDWGIAALHRLHAATKLPLPHRPPHSIYRSPVRWAGDSGRRAPTAIAVFEVAGTAVALQRGPAPRAREGKENSRLGHPAGIWPAILNWSEWRWRVNLLSCRYFPIGPTTPDRGRRREVPDGY